MESGFLNSIGTAKFTSFVSDTWCSYNESNPGKTVNEGWLVYKYRNRTIKIEKLQMYELTIKKIFDRMKGKYYK